MSGQQKQATYSMVGHLKKAPGGACSGNLLNQVVILQCGNQGSQAGGVSL